MSRLFTDLRKDGFSGELVGIDYSPSVIKQMKQLYPKFTWVEGDAHDMRKHFANESFDLVIDKATSDGLLCSKKSAIKTPQIYAEVARILKPNGIFIIISVNDPEHGKKWHASVTSWYPVKLGLSRLATFLFDL